MKRNAFALLAWMALLAVLGTLTSLESSASAQTKSKSRKRPPAAKPTPPPDFAVQRTKVAEQISIVSRFIFVYGKVTNGFETAMEQEKTNQASPEVIARNQLSREKLVANIGNLKTGIDDLGRTFQSDSRLQVQYLKLTGAADSIASAQNAVRAGRFEDGGKALVQAVERLTDTVIAIK